jgi:NADH dehydrogenase
MILVVGATGLAGGMIARGLLAKGKSVRALVRESSDYRGLIEAGAEIAFGDLKNAASLEPAMRGVDVVITTASAGQRGGADTPISVDLEGNGHLIAAAREAGVRQFIYISALTASVDSPVPLPRAKARTEITLRESGLTFTILAANGIMDVMLPIVIEAPLNAGKPVTLCGEGQRRHSFVAARDIAAFALAAVDHPKALNSKIPVVGPAAVSWRDIVAEYDRQLERKTALRFVAPGELLPDLPPVAGLTELVSGLLAALESFDTPADTIGTAETFGVTPTTLRAFVAGRLRVLSGRPQ